MNHPATNDEILLRTYLDSLPITKSINITVSTMPARAVAKKTHEVTAFLVALGRISLICRRPLVGKNRQNPRTWLLGPSTEYRVGSTTKRSRPWALKRKFDISGYSAIIFKHLSSLSGLYIFRNYASAAYVCRLYGTLPVSN